MTKPVVPEDLLRTNLSVELPKIDVCPKIVDDPLLVGSSGAACKPKSKVRVRAVKSPMAGASAAPRKTRLGKVTAGLYDLEGSHGPEKHLDVDFGLYQMEDY